MRRGLACVFALLAVPAGADPLAAPAPRLRLAAEASGTFAPEDPYFFNYTDHEYTALRLGRASLAAELRVASRLSVLAEARSDNLERPRIHGLYARFRPLADRDVDLQAGLVPPVFGAFPRRSYAADNFLIGQPLAYQYLTAIRGDALPATTADLIRMRGRGWRPRFPLGSQEEGPGLAIVSTLRWDTGLQARAVFGPVETLAAVTTGTLSRPRVREDNGGKQVSGRVAWRPVAGLVVGASAARGAYADKGALPFVDADSLRQRAWGGDVEYSRGYWLVRGEGAWTGWDVPLGGMAAPARLRARALSAEGRYKLAPGLYAAARVDHLGFGRLPGSSVTWDAPVFRFEGGGGYHLGRHLLLKAVYQHNRRDGGRMPSQALVAGQLLYWY